MIGVFCCALIGIVVWGINQRNDNSADYFLGGKDATWIAIGANIFVSNIGSEHLIGLTAAGAFSGMAVAHWEVQGGYGTPTTDEIAGFDASIARYQQGIAIQEAAIAHK